jgi:hypothetical protein
MRDRWILTRKERAYSSSTRNQLKKKRKALRSNPNFKGYLSDLIPISFNSETGELRMPMVYIADINIKGKRDASP